MKPIEYEKMFDAEEVHWWYKNLRNEVIYWIKEILATRSDSEKITVLDLGCGTGGMLQRLQEKFGNLRTIGIDYYLLALDYAKKRTTSPLVQGDIKNMPFLENSIDVILCLDVLYTKEAYPGLQKALKAVYNTLKENGVFIMQLPAFECLKSQHDTNVHGAHRFNSDEIRRGLTQCGFSDFKVYYRYNTLMVIAWFVRKFFKKEENKSHVVKYNLISNFLLYRFFAIESWVNKRLLLPFGLSVFSVACKKRG